MTEIVLCGKSKKIERQHIEKQMLKIGMDQPTCDKGIGAFALRYAVRVKDKIIVNLIVAKGQQTNQQGYNKYGRRNRRLLYG